MSFLVTSHTVFNELKIRERTVFLFVEGTIFNPFCWSSVFKLLISDEREPEHFPDSGIFLALGRFFLNFDLEIGGCKYLQMAPLIFF